MSLKRRQLSSAYGKETILVLKEKPLGFHLFEQPSRSDTNKQMLGKLHSIAVTHKPRHYTMYAIK